MRGDFEVRRLDVDVRRGVGWDRRPEWKDESGEKTFGEDLQDNDNETNNDGVYHVRYGPTWPLEKRRLL